MKRILTIAVAVLCSALVFAQTKTFESNVLRTNSDRNDVVISKEKKQIKTREVAWSCDFEGEQTFTTSQDVASDLNWEIQTISESTGGDRYWALNYYGSEEAEENIYSETPNHWVMLEGIEGNNGLQDVNSTMTFSNIDLSSLSYPVISFYEYRRLANMPFTPTTMEVSINGGATWTEHVVGCESSSEHFYAQRQIALPEATGSDNVIIRFRAKRLAEEIGNYYTGLTPATLYTCGAPFFVNWQIDDITIGEAPLFDFVLKDIRINDGYCDYHSNYEFYNANGWNIDAADAGKYYHYQPLAGMTPKTEWANGLFATFNAVVENRGYNEVIPIVNITITDPNGETIYNDDFTSTPIAGFGIDTIDIMERVYEGGQLVGLAHVFSFEEGYDILAGEYTVSYTIRENDNEDPTPDNNSGSLNFYITDDAFCTSTPNITRTAGPNTWSSFEDGGEIAVSYSYTVLPEEQVPVWVYIHEESTPDVAAINVNIYEYSSATSSFEMTLTSGTYTIREADLGNWVKIDLEEPFIIEDFDEGYSSKSVRVAVAFWENGGELYLGASNDMPNKGWVCSYNLTGTNFTCYNVADDASAPAIALGHLFDDPIDPVEPGDDFVNSFENSNIGMYPNPTTGMVNFSNVENATIEVINLMGQVVANTNSDNTNTSIDLSKVANGSYIVRIVKDGEIATSRLNIVK
ncbi:MAG: T9SS type A sorting domain-containing protein [Bacteroidales bacterium]|nr:T9SS type A sorting domain-containing protein [Bacteroidales bacterium]